MTKPFHVLLLLLAALTRPAWSGPLQDCADQFIGSDIKNAPTLYDSSPTKPFANNVHLCYQDDDASFFAIEYWPEQFAPRCYVARPLT